MVGTRRPSHDHEALGMVGWMWIEWVDAQEEDFGRSLRPTTYGEISAKRGFMFVTKVKDRHGRGMTDSVMLATALGIRGLLSYNIGSARARRDVLLRPSRGLPDQA